MLPYVAIAGIGVFAFLIGESWVCRAYDRMAVLVFGLGSFLATMFILSVW